MLKLKKLVGSFVPKGSRILFIFFFSECAEYLAQTGHTIKDLYGWTEMEKLA